MLVAVDIKRSVLIMQYILEPTPISLIRNGIEAFCRRD